MPQTVCPTQDGSISEDPYGAGIVECERCGCKYHAPCAELWTSKGCYKCGATPLITRRDLTPSSVRAVVIGRPTASTRMSIVPEPLRRPQARIVLANPHDAQRRTSRTLILILGLLIVLGLGAYVWEIASTNDRHEQVTHLQGRIIVKLAPAATIPNWLQNIAGRSAISPENYPPPPNFLITDRCAGEACGYQRPWRALKQVPLFSEWAGRNARLVYTLSQREVAYAESGVWITKKPGVFEVTEPISIGQIDLQPGEYIYSFMYLGEGFMRGVVHGYLAEFAVDGPNNRSVMRKLSDYDATLWVQMKTGIGVVGWTNDTAYPSFDGQSPSAGTPPYILVGKAQDNGDLWDYELEVFTGGNKASIVIGDVVIRCAETGVQKVHTGFVVPDKKPVPVELIADEKGELLAKTFVEPGVALGELSTDPPTPLEPQISLGAINVLAPAGAEVILDGVSRGKVDDEGAMALMDVITGGHQLVVQKPNYATGTYEVNLAKGENKVVSANLRMVGGYLTVRIDRPGTEIRVSALGNFHGVVSDLACPPGQYTIAAWHPLMRTETRSVEVTTGEHTTVEINMMPDPRAIQARLSDAERQAMGPDPRGAISIVNEVLSLDPNNASARGLLAEIYLRTSELRAFASSAEEALRMGGTIRFSLIHDHAGRPRFGHAVIFTLTGRTISFSPIGQRSGCALPSGPISVQRVGSIQVARSHSGEIFLVLELPISPASDRQSEFRFFVLGSHLERRIVSHLGGMIGLTQNVQVSPGNAPEVLDAVADVIRQAKSSAQ
jgi:PEGA domain